MDRVTILLLNVLKCVIENAYTSKKDDGDDKDGNDNKKQKCDWYWKGTHVPHCNCSDDATNFLDSSLPLQTMLRVRHEY